MISILFGVVCLMPHMLLTRLALFIMAYMPRNKDTLMMLQFLTLLLHKILS
jgi:hypothetical protein